MVDGEAAHLRSELRWFAASLGEARNLDVLLAAKGPNGRAPDRAARKQLPRSRLEAYAGAQTAFAERRLPAAILDLVAWIEVGAWRGSELAAGTIAGFATDRLERGWKRVRRQAKALRALEPEGRPALTGAERP